MCVSASEFEGFTPATVLTGDLAPNRQLLVYANGINPTVDLSSSRGASGNPFEPQRILPPEVGNAMLLHVPADIDTIDLLPATSAQLREFGDLLNRKPLPQIRTDYYSGMRGGLLGGSSTGAFSQGAYDIGFATPSKESIDSAFEAIRALNADYIPPNVSGEMIEYYKELAGRYGALTLVVAGFNPSRGMDAHPIALSYQSSIEEIFAPGLERHDGKPPVDGEYGLRDFRVFLAGNISYTEEEGFGLDAPSPLGFHEKTNGLNADYVIPRDALEVVRAIPVESAEQVIIGGLMLFNASNPERRAQWSGDFRRQVPVDNKDTVNTGFDDEGWSIFSGHHNRVVSYPAYGGDYLPRHDDKVDFQLGPTMVSKEFVTLLNRSY
jgi:hypothetical protein